MGRRRCAWCEKDMGAAATEKDTHGICGDCEKAFRVEAGLPPRFDDKASVVSRPFGGVTEREVQS